MPRLSPRVLAPVPVLAAVAVLVAAGGIALLVVRPEPAARGALAPVATSTEASSSPVTGASPLEGPTSSPGASGPSPSSSPPPTPPLTGPGSANAPQLELGAAVARGWRDVNGVIRAQVLVEVVNEGDATVELLGADVGYVLVDGTGHRLAKAAFDYAFPDVLAPGEQAWFIDTLDLPFAQSATLGEVDVTVASPRASDEQPLRTLEVTDASWRAGNGTFDVSGEIVNTGTGPATSVVVAALLRDAEGEPLCGVYDTTDVGSLDPGARARFEANFPPAPPVDAGDVAGMDVIAFVPAGS